MYTCMPYLTRTTLIAGTVILIDDDGVFNIVHDDVFEDNVFHKPIAWSRPCLNPYPVI